jgi:hypothetical protein
MQQKIIINKYVSQIFTFKQIFDFFEQKNIPLNLYL